MLNLASHLAAHPAHLTAATIDLSPTSPLIGDLVEAGGVVVEDASFEAPISGKAQLIKRVRVSIPQDVRDVANEMSTQQRIETAMRVALQEAQTTAAQVARNDAREAWVRAHVADARAVEVGQRFALRGIVTLHDGRTVPGTIVPWSMNAAAIDRALTAAGAP